MKDDSLGELNKVLQTHLFRESKSLLNWDINWAFIGLSLRLTWDLCLARDRRGWCGLLSTDLSSSCSACHC
jgi:hypothetical protein